MKETIESIIKWHTETFPDATLEGQIEKWDDEEKEWHESRPASEEEMGELADMVIVACGIMRFDYQLGFYYLMLTATKVFDSPPDRIDMWGVVEKKMAINRARRWNKCDGKYQHVEE